jgi:hypothetical protein
MPTLADAHVNKVNCSFKHDECHSYQARCGAVAGESGSRRFPADAGISNLFKYNGSLRISMTCADLRTLTKIHGR